MKPVIIIPPELMEEKCIESLRENGFCVVVAKDPSKVRFMDPIPAAAERTKIESAAISLCRKIINPGFWSSSGTRDEMCRNFVDILMSGTPLSNEPTQEEKEKRVYNDAKFEELRRLAKEDARAERAAKKTQAERKESK